MTDTLGPLILTIVAALIAAIPPTLAALAAYKQSMAALATTKQTQVIAAKIELQAQDQALKTGQLVGKVDEVHTLTNSNLAAVKAELAQASLRIENLMAVVVELRSERGKSQLREAIYTPAPARGGDVQTRASDLVPTAREQLDVQKEIAANTELTAEHTDPERKK